MIYRILLFLFFTACGFSVFSSPDEKGEKGGETIKKGQEISFDEIIVQGKRHFSDETVVTVEQDKVLDALLKVPGDFKDRIKMSAKRN